MKQLVVIFDNKMSQKVMSGVKGYRQATTK